jgi:hypothetical protein
MSKGPFWTEDDLEILKNEYKTNGAAVLEKKLGRSAGAIRLKACKLGLKSPHTWEEYEDDVIRAHYLTKSIQEIRELIPHRSYRVITLRAQSLGIHKFKRPIYTTDEKFFEKINNDSAYVLGVIASDGNLTIRENGSWNFKITSKDKEWLLAIRDLMGSNMKLKPVVGQWGHLAWDLIITRRKMIKDLMALGITPKKSMTLQFPNIQDEYVPSFMRGYHDGDGSFSFYRNHKRVVLRSITAGNITFLTTWKEWLNKFGIDTESNIHITKSKIHVLHLSERNSVEFGNMIYNVPGIRLERKYKKYIEGKRLFETNS